MKHPPPGAYVPPPLPRVPEPDPREDKLPAWARDQLRAARYAADRAVAYAAMCRDDAERALLRTDPTDTDTVLSPWDHAPVGLPLGAQVQFRMNRIHDYFDIRTDGGELEILASRPLLIDPRAMNHLRLRVVDR